MATRNIRVEGDPILRKISKPVKEVTPHTQELIDDMIETLAEANGVGLAGVQVGVLKRMCIIWIDPKDLLSEEDSADPKKTEALEPDADGYAVHTGGEPVVVINPEIFVDGDETQTGSEGCLSVPGKWGDVTRPMKVTLRAYDREMKPFEMKARGLLARAICHEADHMDGHMYIDIVEGELHGGEDE